MGKQLVITEKPSVARDITKVLGGFEDHGEYFESDHFLVTFALGHLLELAAPEDYDKALRAWTLATLPIIPEEFKIKPKEGQKKRLDVIKKLARRKDVDGIINACDAGREGEVIFRRILEFCELDDRPHQRLWLQSMTADAIRDGFAHLRPGADLDALADAAWLRGVGDWLIGMNATRALTRRLKGAREKGSWSAGRVQTPTLGLLVAREKEVLAHEPQTYWEVEATFEATGHTWTGKYYDAAVSESEEREQRPNRLFDRARVDAVIAALHSAGTGVAGEKRKKSKQNPPLMFDLTFLQREANRRFSFSAKRTLNAAQRLYEAHKVLTYPRTDSRHLPSDYGENVAKVLEALCADPDVGATAQQIVAEGPKNLDVVLDSTKVSDHFAIVPTGVTPPDDMSSDDRKIYELVSRQFLAALMGPATWATVERLVEVPVADAAAATFRTTARSLEIPGFLTALGFDEGDGTTLPALVPDADVASGITAAILDAEEAEKETRPPSRHSEAGLLRLMETAGERLEDEGLVDAMKGRGLGTPATRADIIERLLTTGYSVRVDGKLAPTPKGMRLMDILERAKVPVLASARLTGEWENNLKLVESGSSSRATALDGLVRFTRDATEALARFDHDALYASEPSLGVCPSCGRGEVVETPWGYRCTRNEKPAAKKAVVADGEEGAAPVKKTRKKKTDEDKAAEAAVVEDRCHFFLWKERGGRYIDRKLAHKLVNDRHSDRVIGFVDRFGRALEGRIVLEAESPIPGAQWNMRLEFGAAEGGEGAEVVGDVVFPCPCGNAECRGIIETTTRFVCQRLLEGLAKTGPILPRTVCSRTIELEEAQVFFGEEGGTPMLTGFISRRGRPFTGRLVRRESGKHAFEFPPREPRGKKGKAEGEEGEAEVGAEAPVKKAAAKKAPAKKAAADAEPAKKAAPKKAVGVTAAAKKAPAKKAAAEGAEASPPKKARKAAEAADEPAKAAAPKKAATKKKAPAKKAGAKAKSAAEGEATPKAPRKGAKPSDAP